MDPEKREVLERQGYRIVGEHSGVKLCHWTKASLTKGIGCYKQTFYGIESHRCLQMTPAVDACNLACQFCWRTQEWGSDSLRVADDPSFIVVDSMRVQRELLSCLTGNPHVEPTVLLESWHSTHGADPRCSCGSSATASSARAGCGSERTTCPATPRSDVSRRAWRTASDTKSRRSAKTAGSSS